MTSNKKANLDGQMAQCAKVLASKLEDHRSHMIDGENKFLKLPTHTHTH